jgi:hypothetical protein
MVPWKMRQMPSWLPSINAQADVMELIRLSQEAIDRSKELIMQIDAALAKSPLKP